MVQAHAEARALTAYRTMQLLPCPCPCPCPLAPHVLPAPSRRSCSTCPTSCTSTCSTWTYRWADGVCAQHARACVCASCCPTCTVSAQHHSSMIHRVQAPRRRVWVYWTGTNEGTREYGRADRYLQPARGLP